MEAQIQQAVEVASGSSADNAVKQQALSFIQQLNSSPDGWKHCLSLLASTESGNTLSHNVKFFIFQVFDSRIPTLQDQEKITLKDTIFTYIKGLISKNEVEPTFLRNAVAKSLGLLFVHCTLTCYQTMIKDLLAMATNDGGNTFNELATDYYIKTLVIIHQEIGDQMIIKDKESSQRSNMLKDFIRDHYMLTMVQSWKQILTHFTDPSAQVTDKRLVSEIIDGTLMAIGFYSSWIEINLILDQEFLNLFYRCLTSTDQKVQIRTTNTLTDILHKKMLPPKKLELINFLDLGNFLNNMEFDIKTLDFDFAQALAKLCQQLGSECVLLLDNSTHEALKFDDFRNMGVAKVIEVMPLIFKFLEYEYDDISLEVFPFLADLLLFLKKNIVNEDLDLSALNGDEMLTTILKKVILKMRYDDSDDGDDDETIEMFNEVRSKLSSFQDSIVIINDMLSLNVMTGSINEFLFQHMGNSNKQANWRDIELGLYQLNYYSEMLRTNKMNLPKDMLNASRPYYIFNEMLCKVVDNSTEILVSHPLIQLLFFELIMKHHSFFTNSNIQVEGVNKKEILLKILKIFVSNFGMFSDNPKVKYRSWYLFYRFLKLTQPHVDDFVIVELVTSLTGLLTLNFQVSGNAGSNLHDIDLTSVEESGSFENELYLLESIGILVTLIDDQSRAIEILQGVLQPMFSNLEKCISEVDHANLQMLVETHHDLVSIGTLVKGFEGLHASRFTPEFIQILRQISEVVLITLERLDDFNIVREACSFCIIRLFILLSKIGEAHPDILQSVSSKFFSITMNGLDKMKMSEIVNFINFITQLMHSCGSIQQIYVLLGSLLCPLAAKVMARIELENSRVSDDFSRRDLLELKKSFISLLMSVSSDHINSMWLMSDANKQTLANIINLMLTYICGYANNDLSLVKASIDELTVLNHGLGTGRVIDPRDKFKDDNNTLDKVGELLVGNSILACIELTFNLQNKQQLLKDAQFRNGVLLEISRLLRTIAYIGHDVPDTNKLKQAKARNSNNANTHQGKIINNGDDGGISLRNEATCQQISNALVNQVGMPPANAIEFVQRLVGSTDRQFSKYLARIIG